MQGHGENGEPLSLLKYPCSRPHCRWPIRRGVNKLCFDRTGVGSQAKLVELTMISANCASQTFFKVLAGIVLFVLSAYTGTDCQYLDICW